MAGFEAPIDNQQMIGRGLRGPGNKGTEICLIVDVADNFDRYGPNILSFPDFDYLWNAVT